MAPVPDDASSEPAARRRPEPRHQTAQIIPVDARTEIRVCVARNGISRLYVRRGQAYVYADLDRALASQLSQALGAELDPEAFRGDA